MWIFLRGVICVIFRNPYMPMLLEGWSIYPSPFSLLVCYSDIGTSVKVIFFANFIGGLYHAPVALTFFDLGNQFLRFGMLSIWSSSILIDSLNWTFLSIFSLPSCCENNTSIIFSYLYLKMFLFQSIFPCLALCSS